MAVTELRNHFEYTTEFAAVESPCQDLVEVLARSNGFKKKYIGLKGESVSVEDHDHGLAIAFSVPGSMWTIIDPVMSRQINLDAVDRATKKLKTQAIGACFCRNTGSFGYFHTRNGRPIEEFCCTDPEFHEDSIDEAKRKGWQTCSAGHRRLKTKRSIVADLDSIAGFQLLSELTDELGVDIPAPLTWEIEEDSLQVELFTDAAKQQAVSPAFLLMLR